MMVILILLMKAVALPQPSKSLKKVVSVLSLYGHIILKKSIPNQINNVIPLPYHIVSPRHWNWTSTLMR